MRVIYFTGLGAGSLWPVLPAKWILINVMPMFDLLVRAMEPVLPHHRNRRYDPGKNICYLKWSRSRHRIWWTSLRARGFW